ncbi:response regulator [Bacillus sp. B15-48]|uniref:response regulator n=1 Tax=Bacillus sp. B15-48 TaxID=1548601 RepID=UPI0019400267|nr:response regulator [Bacillus sp. B15-48]MBM4764510.1 response regulator [Bacillus sp. B15-48]
MKIKTKLLLGLSIFPILIFLLLAIVWFQFSGMQKIITASQEGNTLKELAVSIHIGVKNEAISMRNLVIWEEQASLEKEVSRLQKESDAVTQNIAALGSQVDTAEEKEMVDNLKSLNANFTVYKDQVVRLITEGKKGEAIELINRTGHPIHEEFFKVTADITRYFATNMNSSLEAYQHEFEQSIKWISFIAIIIIIVVMFLITKNIWSIVQRLNGVSSVMSRVANGKEEISTRVEVHSSDEIDEVASSFNKMLHSLEEQIEKEQNLIWSKSSITDVITSLYGKHDLETLSRTLLSKIVPLTESGHAVVYVKDLNETKEKEPSYKLLASYGYKERKHLSTTFTPGEGLIGQAVLEKTPIILTNVPADYVQIHSGLGEAPPLNVYVLPIIFGDDVEAVLEIASFKPFDENKQTFLEEIVSRLGIILDSVIGRIQLAKLLEESQTLMEEIQAQSEELQSQQEELRVTNEELEEQAQALRQSEERLQAQQEELEETNVELKKKADVLKEQNEKFEMTNREVEKAHAELEEKARQLAISSKYKSEFLANMSHELRTPLNSLLILSKLLADNPSGNLSEKQIEYSKTIYSSGQDLLVLINDILDLTKIESGKMDVVISKVSLKDLIKFVEQRFRPLANEKGLQFYIDVKPSIPAFIYSDEQRIKQVLKNLLANAFKFTEKGEVKLEIDYHERFAFTVADTGIGIPSEKQELIFEAFQQADGTTSRKYGGTGLGLSISREISSLLGGEIKVKSVEGLGSEFTFYLDNQYESEPIVNEVAVGSEPNKRVKDEQRTNVNTEPSKNKEIKRLLIVDDDFKQRNSLMELIGNMNVIIKAVSTGKEAVEELKVNEVDCLVLDLRLSDTDGFHLLEEIKPYIFNADLKVIIYTGRNLTSKEEMYLNKYSHTIIIKDGHSPQRLVEELELYLSSNSDELEGIEEIETKLPVNISDLKGKDILLVDDDVRNIYAISSILEQYEMNIAFAENGKECLEILKENPNFDLVLMDIMMPEMDGYETIRTIRTERQFEQLPIIALTAKAMKEDRRKCMEAGASDYIRKPVDPDRLISLMAVWLYSQKGK